MYFVLFKKKLYSDGNLFSFAINKEFGLFNDMNRLVTNVQMDNKRQSLQGEVESIISLFIIVIHDTL